MELNKVLDWVKETPRVGGWYWHRKDGVETRCFLREYGFVNHLMPGVLLFSMKDEITRNGKNIAGITHTEFKNCEWMGPLSGTEKKQWFE
jgi:hypothetical protein